VHPSLPLPPFKTLQDCVNPTDVVTGLSAVLKRLIALPDGLLTPDTVQLYQVRHHGDGDDDEKDKGGRAVMLLMMTTPPTMTSTDQESPDHTACGNHNSPRPPPPLRASRATSGACPTLRWRQLTTGRAAG
jgi:hypothetical protein